MTSFKITAQKEDGRRKRISDRTWDLHSFAELQPWAIGPILHSPSPYVLVVGMAQYSNRLGPKLWYWYYVFDDSGLSGRERVAWTCEPVLDVASSSVSPCYAGSSVWAAVMLWHTYDWYIRQWETKELQLGPIAHGWSSAKQCRSRFRARSLVHFFPVTWVNSKHLIICACGCMGLRSSEKGWPEKKSNIGFLLGHSANFA